MLGHTSAAAKTSAVEAVWAQPMAMPGKHDAVQGKRGLAASPWGVQQLPCGSARSARFGCCVQLQHHDGFARAGKATRLSVLLVQHSLSRGHLQGPKRVWPCTAQGIATAPPRDSMQRASALSSPDAPP